MMATVRTTPAIARTILVKTSAVLLSHFIMAATRLSRLPSPFASGLPTSLDNHAKKKITALAASKESEYYVVQETKGITKAHTGDIPNAQGLIAVWDDIDVLELLRKGAPRFRRETPVIFRIRVVWNYERR